MQIGISQEPQLTGSLRLAPQLFYLGDKAVCDRVLLRLMRLGIIELCSVASMAEAESAVGTAVGQIILAVTANPDDSCRLVTLAEKIIALNTSSHRYVYLLALLTGMPDTATVDRLEMLGVRVMLQSDGDMLECCLRLLVWRIKRPPSLPVPCFYLHYPDSESLSVFLLGRRGRTELLYGERLGVLFEMLALTHRWATTSQIALELEIGRSSVKVYLDRLRNEYELKRPEAGVDIPAERVFCSERSNGVWMHRMRGQILIFD